MKHLLLLALSAVALMAADATGKWAGTFVPSDGDGSPRPALLILKQEGTTLTGTAGPDESEQNEIANGKAENGVLTFELQRSGTAMKFNLKLDGDEIKGDMSRERDGQAQRAKLHVKRQK